MKAPRIRASVAAAESRKGVFPALSRQLESLETTRCRIYLSEGLENARATNLEFLQTIVDQRQRKIAAPSIAEFRNFEIEALLNHPADPIYGNLTAQTNDEMLQAVL